MKAMGCDPSLDPRVARLIDANLDRAREGLRVVEDWCRFGLDREDLVVTLKDWRQRLGRLHQDRYKKEIMKNKKENDELKSTHPEAFEDIKVSKSVPNSYKELLELQEPDFKLTSAEHFGHSLVIFPSCFFGKITS